MPEEWIEQTLLPQLDEAARREWSVGEVQALVAQLGEQISEAVERGRLSREGARDARALVAETVRVLQADE